MKLMYSLFVVNAVIWTYLAYLLIKTIWHSEIKGVWFSWIQKGESYANNTSYIFLGYYNLASYS
jgi:hypothetical protein